MKLIFSKHATLAAAFACAAMPLAIAQQSAQPQPQAQPQTEQQPAQPAAEQPAQPQAQQPAQVQSPDLTHTSPQGIDYATGAVTVSELEQLQQERRDYSVWITTAAKGSGAWLSDAQVRITDSKQQLVLDTMIVGPWLMAELPRGRYTIETTWEGQTQRRTANVGSGGLQRFVLYFDSPAEVSPDWKSPFREDTRSGLSVKR